MCTRAIPAAVIGVVGTVVLLLTVCQLLNIIAHTGMMLKERYSPCTLIQGVHHLVICTGTSLLDALEKCYVLHVHIEIGISTERSRLMHFELPI